MDGVVFYLLQILIWPLCLGLVGLILLQGGAGDISSAFGGGGQLDSTLGVGAHRKMAKLTGWLAAGFFAMVLVLAIPHKGSYGTAPAKAPEPAKTDTAVPPALPVAAPAVATPAPVVEAPKVDAPAVEAPKADVPAVPVVEAPKAEAPAAPAVEAPKADVPAAPAVETPKQ